MINIIKTTSVILLGLIFSACQPNTSENPNTDNEKSKVEVKVQPDKKCLDQTQLLNEIYQSKFSIDEASENKLSEYFDARLTKLILKEQKCREGGEICDIDFDILTNSQDISDYSYEIKPTKNPFDYYAFITSDSGNQRIIYEFDDLNADHCPKIKHIQYSDGRNL